MKYKKITTFLTKSTTQMSLTRSPKHPQSSQFAHPFIHQPTHPPTRSIFITKCLLHTHTSRVFAYVEQTPFTPSTEVYITLLSSMKIVEPAK